RSLRVRSADGRCVPLLPAGTTVPAQRREKVTLPVEAGSMVVRLVAGDSESETANEPFGEVRVEPPAGHGGAAVEVEWEVDVSGKVTVAVNGRRKVAMTPAGLDPDEQAHWRRTVELNGLSGG
ncbi:MAG: hypothetical protein ACRC33_18240, partial [Gemmataceae bacterium]